MKATNKLVYLFLFLGLFVSACKRDKLDGEAARLVGVWKWDYTYIYEDNIKVDTLYADNFADTYTIEFEEKGVMTWYKNQKKVLRENLVIDSESCNYNPDMNWAVTYCGYRLNGNRFVFALHYAPQPTLTNATVSGKKYFPDFTVTPGQSHWNYFVKVE